MRVLFLFFVVIGSLQSYSQVDLSEIKVMDFNDFKESAEEGNMRAQYYLAVSYNKGKDVVKDVNKAVYWLSKSAKLGYPPAQKMLGDFYYYPIGVAQDLSKAVYWYNKSAEQSYSISQNTLGKCYYEGKGVTQNFNKAVYWYTESAKLGNARAQSNLAFCYFYGNGVAKDKNTAISLMKIAHDIEPKNKYYLKKLNDWEASEAKKEIKVSGTELTAADVFLGLIVLSILIPDSSVNNNTGGEDQKSERSYQQTKIFWDKINKQNSQMLELSGFGY